MVPKQFIHQNLTMSLKIEGLRPDLRQLQILEFKYIEPHKWIVEKFEVFTPTIVEPRVPTMPFAKTVAKQPYFILCRRDFHKKVPLNLLRKKKGRQSFVCQFSCARKTRLPLPCSKVYPQVTVIHPQISNCLFFFSTESERGNFV